MNKYNKILKTTTLFGGVQGLNILLNVVRTKLAATILGPAGVGLNGIYNEARELIHSTSNLGLDVSGVRGISAAYELRVSATTSEARTEADEAISQEVAVLRSWVLLLALLGALICMALSLPLSFFTFSDFDHAWSYVLLSPAVAFSTMHCGELAVLKGLRKLKWLATVSVLSVLIGIAVTIPIYYVWGIDGVLAALVGFTFVNMLMVLSFGVRAEPYRLVYGREALGRGGKMLIVGLNFVAATIMEHIALFSVQAYLSSHDSIATVGLFNAGYAMTMTYTGVVFSALDQDYFPRLSGVIGHVRQRAEVLLHQQDVTLMIMTPVICGILVALPVMVPLLLSGSFTDIIPMAQIAIAGIMFRSIMLPSAYMPLAAGDNKTYFAVNFTSAMFFFVLIVGYELAGLFGMGVALTLQHLLDVILCTSVARIKYGVNYGMRRMATVLAQVLIVAAVYCSCVWLAGLAYWLVGILLSLLALAFSFAIYKHALDSAEPSV